MKIKHHEIIPNEENPFTECKLAREPYARVLTDIVSTYADGFVLAINNEWGTGKTTFIKMWQQLLKNEGFQTVYFNAWENDFDSNPLVAMMAELETLTNAKNKKVFNSVVKKGAILVKNIAPALAKSLIKKNFGNIDDYLADAIENTTKATTEILEEEIKKYSSKKKTIVEFRKELEKFAKVSGNLKPLVIFVDELDRCRPSYSVEVLEQIKHLFSVSGIVFVLSIDKHHLGSAVKGFYGSELIDSNEYLRRFIDLEYSIPSPQPNLFIEYLFTFYQFNDFFSSDERRRYTAADDDGPLLIKTATYLFTKEGSTLRQQERVFALTRLVLCSVKSNQFIFPELLFILVYFKILQNELFKKIEGNKLTVQALSELFFESTYSGKNFISEINLLYIEALLLWFYNNKQSRQDKIELIIKDEHGNLNTPIKSKIENKDTRINLAQCFEHITKNWSYESVNLDYLLNKINLTESITINKK